MSINESARIYNLFPRLVGKIPNWVNHFPRIVQMKFNWIFLNPINYTGFSGSLYSIKDYYKLNPLFYYPENGQSESDQIHWMLNSAHEQGLKVMLDLVINHTAVDHPFTVDHKSWYKLKDGKIVNPGAWDDGKWVSWGDLAEIDNESSPDRKEIWKYWLELVTYYLDLGFDGFRCDAAYKLPRELWEYLIGESKRKHSDVVWFAESLGCPIEETIELSKSGFQYVFNSSKWWDYKKEWCLEQYSENAPYSKSVSFPESHDTPRLFAETKGDSIMVNHKYLFSALFSSGVMIPVGFEYGFQKHLNVVETTPEDYEDTQHDFSDYITKVNNLKSQFQIFNEESDNHQIKYTENPDIIIILKTSINQKERCLLVINSNFTDEQEIFLYDYLTLLSWNRRVIDISPENDISNVFTKKEITLQPGEIKVFYTQND